MRCLLTILAVLTMALPCWGFEISGAPNQYRLGNTLTAGTGARYPTIAAAIAAASAGDEILVVPGTHTVTSSLQLPVGVNIRGGGGSTTITGSIASGIIRPLGNNVISNLVITNTRAGSASFALSTLTDSATLTGKTVLVERCSLSAGWDTCAVPEGTWTLNDCILLSKYDNFNIAGGSVTCRNCRFALDNSLATAYDNAVFAITSGTSDATVLAVNCSLQGSASKGGAKKFGVIRTGMAEGDTATYTGVGNRWVWDMTTTPAAVAWLYKDPAYHGGTLNVTSYGEEYLSRSATTNSLYVGNDTAARLSFHGGNAGTLQNAVSGTTNAVLDFRPSAPDYGIIEETVDFASHTEAWKAMSVAVPAGAVIISVQANVDAALTTGGTTAHLIIGDHTAVAATYGVADTLTKNSQINTQIAQASLAELVGATTFDVIGAVAANNALGDTDITAGKVFVRIVYRKVPAIRKVP